MKTKVKNISDVKVELTISLGVEELKAAEQVALTKLAKEVKIEGFRKGKAPLEMVAAQVDQNVLGQEIIENALSKKFRRLTDLRLMLKNLFLEQSLNLQLLQRLCRKLN